jgi:hypothetical protein
MQSEVENRTEGRANVFLTAVLDTAAASVPVRIRNISRQGALIEGTKLPRIGERIRLLRGSLVAPGTLAWEGQGHAGVNFDRQIDVDSWVRRIGHAGQQQVDGIVAAIRRAEPVAQPEPQPGASPLGALSLELDELCDRFASSSAFPLELSEDLLKLDVIAQTLRGLAGRRRC